MAHDLVKITVHPQPAYIELGRMGQQFVNFDFAIENLSEDPLSLDEITLEVYDSHQQLVARKFLDGNGSSPNILTIPQREFAPRQTQLLFNPFHTFDADLPLAEMRFTFELSLESTGSSLQAWVTVKPQAYQNATRLTLPVAGRSLIYDGHDFYAHHRRFDYAHAIAKHIGISTNFMRYAYDFCPVDPQGQMVHGDWAVNENWVGFGKPIVATGAGKVVAILNEMADNRRFDEAALVERPMLLFGNYLVIDHTNGEFSLFAHLQENSIKVQLGEQVVAGQHIANIGASGSANIPHLHYELRTAEGILAEGLPSYFHNFRRIVGAQQIEVAHGLVDTGDIIEQSNATPHPPIDDDPRGI